MTALVQFDPIPEFQLPTIWINFPWGMNITYRNPDGSIADLTGCSGELVVNDHAGASATNLFTWDATSGAFTFGNGTDNIQIARSAAATLAVGPDEHEGAYAYFTVIDTGGNPLLFFKGPVDIKYGGR